MQAQEEETSRQLEKRKAPRRLAALWTRPTLTPSIVEQEEELLEKEWREHVEALAQSHEGRVRCSPEDDFSATTGSERFRQTISSAQRGDTSRSISPTNNRNYMMGRTVNFGSTAGGTVWSGYGTLGSTLGRTGAVGNVMGNRMGMTHEMRSKPAPTPKRPIYPPRCKYLPPRRKPEKAFVALPKVVGPNRKRSYEELKAASRFRHNACKQWPPTLTPNILAWTGHAHD